VIRLGKGGEKIIMANFKKTRIAKLEIALGCIVAIAAVTASSLATPARAEPLALAAPSGGFSIFDRVLRDPIDEDRLSALEEHVQRRGVLQLPSALDQVAAQSQRKLRSRKPEPRSPLPRIRLKRDPRMVQHQRLGGGRGDDLAGDKPSLDDQFRREGQCKEVENFGVEGRADVAIDAVQTNLDAACGVAKRGERGQCR